MNKLMALRANLKEKRARKRGFTMIETVLVLAIGLSLIVGGIVYYMQADSSSVISDKTRLAVGVSSEVRSQARTLESFNHLSTGAPVAAGSSVKTFVMENSAIPAAQFNAIDIMADGQEFDIVLTNLSETVCFRLGLSDLGPNSSIPASYRATCEADGELTITYTR